MFQDIRYALRNLRRNPGFTIVAVLSVALGIGASTAVFSFVSTMLLKPPPYPNPERIVFPWRQAPPGLNLGYIEIPWNLRQVHAMEELAVFQNVGAFQSDYFNLTGSGEPVRLDGMRGSAGFFGALGVTPALGRVFTSEEDQPGREHEVIMSHRLWRDRFNSDSGIVGRKIELSGSLYTVVGVMPPGFAFPRAEEMPAGFEFPRAPELWVPLALPPAPLHPWDPDELAVVARLKPGISIDQAQAEMDVFAHRMEINPRSKGWFNSRITTLTQQITGQERRPLLLILAAVGVVLLIACSNVASLVLARSLGRSHEFTLRAALGAGNRRLIRQVLTENIVLAAWGGGAGLLLASILVQFAKSFGPGDLPRLGDVTLDGRIFLFALGLTLLAGALFGIAPAVSSARSNLAGSLKEGSSRSVGSRMGPKIRKALLVSQIALALVLVVSAALLTQTFLRLWRVDPGYRPGRVLTFEMSLPEVNYRDPARSAVLFTDVLRRLNSLPGVQYAGIAKTIPLGGAPDSTGIRIAGRDVTSITIRPIASYNVVSPGYFSAVGTSILRGRELIDGDVSGNSAPVVVINRTMAETFWPGQDAIGQQVGPGSLEFPLMTVVGIAADVKDLSMRQVPGPEMYVPYTVKTYVSLLTMQAVVRTKADPAAMAKSVAAAIHDADPALPIAKVATMETLVDRSMAQPRFAMLLLAAFGMLALILAAIGMYGVISYSVAQRTREIGMRVVLGAGPLNVVGLVLGQGAKIAGWGIGIGLLAAMGVTRLMASFLFGVGATDPLTFAGVTGLLAGIALIACYVPARRATRLDPMEAIRHD